MLIKKPSEIEPKRFISMLITGDPGIGKTTLGCSAPNPVLFDYDGGVQRVNSAHQVPTFQPTCWEETEQALQEIAELERKGELKCESIVIDTCGKMLDYMTVSIARTDPKLAKKDGSLTIQGFGRRKIMFYDFIRRINISGKNVIFIAHSREDKQGDQTIKRAEITGSSAADLYRDLDLAGYMEAVGKKRVIHFGVSETYYTKNCCGLPDELDVDTLLDEDGGIVAKNDLLTRVITAYQDHQTEEKKKKQEYTKLIDSYADALKEVTDVDSLNEVTASFQKAKHILDSKVVIGRQLAAKAGALGCRYNRENNCYETA